MTSPALETTGSTQAELFEIADRVLPGSALGSYSLADDIRLIYSHGKGSRMWDVDGNEYIEYGMGLRSVTLGHAYPAVVAAAARQMELLRTFKSARLCEKSRYYRLGVVTYRRWTLTVTVFH